MTEVRVMELKNKQTNKHDLNRYHSPFAVLDRKSIL